MKQSNKTIKRILWPVALALVAGLSLASWVRAGVMISIPIGGIDCSIHIFDDGHVDGQCHNTIPYTPTPTATVSATMTSTATPAPSATATSVPPTVTPTATDTPAPTQTPTMTPTATPAPSATATSVPQVGGRGWVTYTAGGDVRTDNGLTLRGEALRLNLQVADDMGTSDPGDDLTYLQTAVMTSTWQHFADHNLNAVRVLLYRPCQFGYPGAAGCNNDPQRTISLNAQQYLDAVLPTLDQVVDIAQAWGFYVIVDLHAVGSMAPDAFAFWSAVAPRYAGRSHVIYELNNEPVQWHPGAYSDAALQFQIDLYNHVRALAPDTPLILWTVAQPFGNAWDAKIARTANLSDTVLDGVVDYSDNVIAGYHVYKFSESTVNEVRPVAPVMNTEIGAGNCTQAIPLVATAEAYGASWLGLDVSHKCTPAQYVTWAPDPLVGAP